MRSHWHGSKGNRQQSLTDSFNKALAYGMPKSFAVHDEGVAFHSESCEQRYLLGVVLLGNKSKARYAAVWNELLAADYSTGSHKSVYWSQLMEVCVIQYCFIVPYVITCSQ